MALYNMGYFFNDRKIAINYFSNHPDFIHKQVFEFLIEPMNKSFLYAAQMYKIDVVQKSQLTISTLQRGQFVNGFLYSGWRDSPKQGGEVNIVDLQGLLWYISQHLHLLRGKNWLHLLRGCLLLSLGVDVERQRGQLTNEQRNLKESVSGPWADNE